MEFVRQSGVTPARSTFDEHWDRALDMYDASQFKAAIAEFDNVLQFMPDLPDARKFRAAAVDGEDHQSVVQKTVEAVGTTGIYVIVGALLLGAILVLALRRSPAKSAPAQRVMTRTVMGTNNTTPQIGSGGAARPTVLEMSYGSIQFGTGSLAGRTFKIGTGGLWVGRDPRCGVVLTDETVSAEHAMIVPMDGGVFVIDKGSSNGTYVNSVDSPRVSKIELRDGDRIYIGKKGPVATYSAN
jgi:FHA domain